eukprot:1000618-Pleurochrysis_carterae.AAC.1
MGARGGRAACREHREGGGAHARNRGTRAQAFGRLFAPGVEATAAVADGDDFSHCAHSCLLEVPLRDVRPHVAREVEQHLHGRSHTQLQLSHAL